MTHLGNVQVEFGNAAKPQCLQLKSPRFYIPNLYGLFGLFKPFDVQIIELESTLNDIEPVSLPSNDFYFIENKELVTVTLRNELKERLRSNRHEKCTKIHMGKRCVRQYLDKSRIPAPGLQNLSSIEEASMLCTTEYETIPGESGGPLMQKLPSGKWALVGIVSGTLRGFRNYFIQSEFVSTAGHLNWINSIILQ